MTMVMSCILCSMVQTRVFLLGSLDGHGHVVHIAQHGADEGSLGPLDGHGHVVHIVQHGAEFDLWMIMVMSCKI